MSGRDVGIGLRIPPELAGGGRCRVELGTPVELSWGWASDTGRRRRRNEDSILADRTVFLVADGMGGHARGDVASRRTMHHMSVLAGRTDVDSDRCVAAVQEAADAVEALDCGGDGAAGTTLTGVVVTEQGGGPYWLCLNIGDSRTYLWRDGRLEQVTVDHSAVGELLERGVITAEEALVHPERNVITRAIGAGQDPRADLWMVPLHPGDRVLVCTDGVTRELRDEEIAHHLSAGTDPETGARSLVRAAVDAGGRDNATAVVVAVAGDPSPDPATTVEDAPESTGAHTDDTRDRS